MNKYQKLAAMARSAIANRRKNAADLNELISGDLPTPRELEGGKFAEISSIENCAITNETKVFESRPESGCSVDTTTSHLTPLLNSPQVQKMILQARIQAKREKTRKANEVARTSLPVTSWKRTSQDEKFRYAGHAADRIGGQAFSLNLSEKAQKKLRAHVDPLRAFTDTLNRELKKQGLSGMPYALVLEDSAQDKLHVHGFLIPPAGAAKAVKRALKVSGGTIAGRAGSRQLTIKTLSEGTGWAFYCRKDQERTNGLLAGDARLFLNRAMTAVARELSG